MYDFAELEAVYENIVSTEKSLAEFSHYAIYELEGGFYVWNECKEKILQGIALQKICAELQQKAKILRQNSGKL